MQGDLLAEHFLEDLDFALGGVGADGLELVLRLHHRRALGTLTEEMNGVELTFGGAKAAADALVFVYFRGAAAETACGLLLDLRLSERQTVVPEGLGLGGIAAWVLTLGVVVAERHHGVVLIELDKLTQISVERELLAGLHEAMQGNGALAACGDRIDGKLRAGQAVAADEDVKLIALIGDLVGLGKTALVKADFPDGVYTNLIDKRPVEVFRGRIASHGEPIILM